MKKGNNTGSKAKTEIINGFIYIFFELTRGPLNHVKFQSVVTKLQFNKAKV